MKKYKFIVIGLLAGTLLTGCASATDVTEKAGQAISDEIQHQASKTDPNVQAIKNGTLGEYNHITVGESFEAFFAEPKWKYFAADTGEDVVEFTGYCTYQDVRVLARLQFIVDEETFEIGALSFNDVPQAELIKVGLLSKIYEVEEDAAIQTDVETESTTVEATDEITKDTVVETGQIDEMFTENVIGFDVQEFANKIFKDTNGISEFLGQYGFEIYMGDTGAFRAMDELGTILFIGTDSTEQGYITTFFEAEVPSYSITLNEVKKICDPNNNKDFQYDAERASYYYSTTIDECEVIYHFSYDSLRVENPEANYITIAGK